MTSPDFEATWIPRIGEDATAALRRFRWAGGIVPATAIVLGVAATYAFDGGILDKLLGVVLLAGAVGAFAIFVVRLRRLKAAISDWFGVEIRGLPLMNTKDFDRYCEKEGYQRPDDQAARRTATDGVGPIPRT